MKKGMMVFESMDVLIKAVQEYNYELQINKKILQNAAYAFDDAMESDDNARKYISRLNDALEKLEATSKIAENVAESLMQEKQNALYTYED